MPWLPAGVGQDGKLWNSGHGRSGELSHFSDEISACICSNVDLHVHMCGFHPVEL